ncbi:hypothetical protein LSH36_18g11063 [Paralvinella palmiformis]|uniref:CP-type G domain-containing protein n=1 Tax=Paralvinella palmiformis TaxID=53620 RepID=A0AAD9KBT0_9ANNE|nr:hypothetical protein LSH36_18g11063 [Paralvinella palmiformis]
MRKFFKKKSKRISTKKRTKIERKVREHNRKVKKEAKQNPLSRRKKNVSVPNNCPFKEEVLKEAEDHKRALEEEREKLKERRKKERQKLMNQKRSLDGFVQDAQKRAAEYDNKKAFVEEQKKILSSSKSIELSLKQYYREFKKVIDAADVVLEVLDARDPLGCRCPQVEQGILNAGPNKRLVLLLNKVDLVPRENVEKWLKYLRCEFPTVAFKASTQSQSNKLGRSKVPLDLASDDLRKSSRCLGAELLLKLLGNYCRNKDIRTSINVGVVGFPNTGKSSIINSLKRSKACSIGATPGVTKSMQLVQLDKHVMLLDSPGIVMATGQTDAATILRNCVRVENIDDPVPTVNAILRRCTKHKLMMQYGLPDFSDVNEFLALLAKKMGKLRKGGVPDVRHAGKRVIHDWNQGHITYYTHPPETEVQDANLGAQIVTEMSKEFDIDSLLADEEQTLKGLKSVSTTDVVMTSEGPTEGFGKDCEKLEDAEQELMEEENDVVNALAGQLSDALEGAFGSLSGDNDDYDFETDF